jgi:hypothetical protein
VRALGILMAVVVVSCGGRAGPPVVRTRAAPRLPPPIPIDLGVRGASYLTGIAQHLQPPWGQFLEDCRLRLGPTHALNVMTLSARAELAIDRSGRVDGITIATSGNADFDLAVREVLAEAPQLGAPPFELLSDDDRVHLRWLFARDRRQAGPATAEVVTVELPLEPLTERLVAGGELERAARRIASAPATDPDRLAATERVMIAVLREALGSPGASRVAAEAIGRAGVRSLAPDVRALLPATTDTDLRLVAIAASAAIGDEAAVPVLAAQLRLDLADHPRLALAETDALIALGHRDAAVAAIRHVLEDPAASKVVALQAHARAPVPALAPRLATWFARGDARMRAAVCAAIGPEAPAPALVARGLRDPDATVRATCVDAVVREGKAHVDPAMLGRLRELARDRDGTVRTGAVAALAVVDPSRSVRPVADRAPDVRAAAAASATDPELRTLAVDPDPDVRAAALTRLGDRAPDLAASAVRDVAPQVRRAAIRVIADEDTLASLARDDSPDVATAALVQLVARRGRSVMTHALLSQLAVAPAGSAERVRIALAWLLGR